MNPPKYTDLLVSAAEANGIDKLKATEYVAEMEDSYGFLLLKWGITSRILLLQREMVTMSPYDAPQKIVEMQAEIRALEFIGGGFVQEMENLFLSIMAEKRSADNREQVAEQEDTAPYIEI